jgi:hypothetical protein
MNNSFDVSSEPLPTAVTFRSRQPQEEAAPVIAIFGEQEMRKTKAAMSSIRRAYRS